MEIRIRYFASFREVTGKSEEWLEVPEGASVAEARARLLGRYPRLQGIMERSLCAVNRSYVAPETRLHEGDELVFIPPMGGGQQSRKDEQAMEPVIRLPGRRWVVRRLMRAFRGRGEGGLG